MTTGSQLPLNLRPGSMQADEDFIVTSANRHAANFVDSWPNWPNPIAILAGPIGVGKSLLASIWAQNSGAISLSAEDNAPERSQVIRNVLIEDIEPAQFDETALFHLINTVRSNHGHLLMTSRYWPGSWQMSLPDLKSRMGLAHVIEMGEPDDDLLHGVLAKLFAELQVEVDKAVIDYLVLRMERSLGCAQNLVATLNELSMAQKRPMTKPLAAEALRRLGLQE